jgi:hypothetical protein
MGAEVTRIRVGRFDSGIINLREAILEAKKTCAGKSDQEKSEFLLTRLKKDNYIPDQVSRDYARAFLREYKKAAGEPVDTEADGPLEILVLGQGCAQCDALERLVMTVMSELQLTDAVLEHVTDIKAIARTGVMGVPALMVAGQVKSVGSLPSKSQLIEWLSPHKK